MPSSDNKDEFQEMGRKVMDLSPIVRRCTIQRGASGFGLALISLDDDEAANMCREQIDGLIEQAVQKANANLATDRRILGWQIVSDDMQE